MNDEGGPAKNRPQPRSLPFTVSAEAARLRSGIWVALEAIEAGDYWIAGDILLALVEDGPDLQKVA
jgi:hypothetical protein